MSSKLAKENPYYRRVVKTTDYSQTVLMSLKPGRDIPTETHDGIDQHLIIVSGDAYVRIDNDDHNLFSGDYILIEAGKEHYVKNIGYDDLKIISVYSPPEHPDNRIDV